MTTTDTISAYQYRAAFYCPEHIIDAMIARGDASPAARDMAVEDALEQIAAANAIDREDESSFDTDDFPKVVFADQLEADEFCDAGHRIEGSEVSLQSRANEALQWFETALRDENDPESRYVRVKDSAPEWVSDVVYAGHDRGGFFPDDYRYGWTRDALGFIADSDAPEDESHEFADDCVDVYSTNRLHWLASNLNRAAYCDEALAEFGSDSLSSPAGEGIIGVIGLGQFFEAEEVYGLVLRALESV